MTTTQTLVIEKKNVAPAGKNLASAHARTAD